jgi:hypothetical protein
MTAEQDRQRLGEERRLIFQNLVNGVPMENIKAAFRRSETEVWREVEFVGKKIREFRFRRHLPPLPVEGIQALRRNRVALLETLSHLGDTYLSSELVIPKVHIQELDHPSVVNEARAKMRGVVTRSK